MELFSEVYSCYYQVVARILREAGKEPLSRGQISQIVEEDGFSESGLALLPKLLEGEWPLLEKAEDGFRSKVKRLPAVPLTGLQKSWVKALLMESRFQLFFDDEQLAALIQALADTKPLFRTADFTDIDTCIDGDPYSDLDYRKRFREILSAQQERRVLWLRYGSPKGKAVEGDFLPCKLEFSRKDDKFRLYAARIQGGKQRQIVTINLGRITALLPSRERYDREIDLDGWFAENRSAEPIRFCIYPERNAVERCMLHFASYEKRTEYDEKSDSYLCSLWYDKHDEPELLIRILSFGPVVRVLCPDSFVKKIRERVLLQHELLTQVIDT